MPNDRSDLAGVGIVLIAASLFATLGPLSRVAYDQGLAPFSFVTWRAGVGAIGLCAAILLVWRRRRPLVALSSLSGSAKRSLVVAMVVGAALNLAMHERVHHLVLQDAGKVGSHAAKAAHGNANFAVVERSHPSRNASDIGKLLRWIKDHG